MTWCVQNSRLDGGIFFVQITAQDFIDWGAQVAKNHGVEYTKDVKDGWIACLNYYTGGAPQLDEPTWLGLPFMAAPNRQILCEGANVKLFELVDVNGDGEIEFDEFIGYVMPLGITKEDAEFGFRATISAIRGIKPEDVDTEKMTLTTAHMGLATSRFVCDAERDSPFRHVWGRFEYEDLREE